MADDVPREILSKLLKRRESIIREAAALDNLISIYQGLISAPSSESLPVDDQPDLYVRSSPRAVQAAAIARSIDAARRMIIAENRPMKRGELVKALTDKGYVLPGKDKNKVFGTNIWRSGKFRTVGEQGYWPKDVSLPKDRG